MEQCVLSYMNPAHHTFPLCFFKIHIVLPPVSASWSFTCRFMVKILMFHILPMHAMSPVHLNLNLIISGEADRLWLYTSVQWGSVLHLCPLGARCFLLFSLCLIRQSYPTVCESSRGKSTLLTLHYKSCWKLYPPTKPHILQWHELCDTFWRLQCI